MDIVICAKVAGVSAPKQTETRWLRPQSEPTSQLPTSTGPATTSVTSRFKHRLSAQSHQASEH